MRKNKIAFFVLTTITIIAIGVAIFFSINYIGTTVQVNELQSQYTELQSEYDKTVSLLKTDEETLLILRDWYEADGYTDAQEWWNAYNNLKTILHNAREKASNSITSSYITPEQWKTIDKIQEEASDTHSVIKLKNLVQQYYQILEEARQKAEL